MCVNLCRITGRNVRGRAHRLNHELLQRPRLAGDEFAHSVLRSPVLVCARPRQRKTECTAEIIADQGRTVRQHRLTSAVGRVLIQAEALASSYGLSAAMFLVQSGVAALPTSPRNTAPIRRLFHTPIAPPGDPGDLFV